MKCICTGIALDFFDLSSVKSGGRMRGVTMTEYIVCVYECLCICRIYC